MELLSTLLLTMGALLLPPPLLFQLQLAACWMLLGQSLLLLSWSQRRLSVRGSMLTAGLTQPKQDSSQPPEEPVCFCLPPGFMEPMQLV
jgi:hypothetical protein